MSSAPPHVSVAPHAASAAPRDGTYEKPEDKDSVSCTHCEAKKGGRNVILSFDGTSNQFGKNNTNVIELYSRIVKDESQLTYYNSGIGTYARPSVASFKYWRQVLSNKIDLAIAWNFEKVILAGYRWLSDTYKDGDKIFLFGYSRGAYQVRALAGMISKVGLILPGNEEQIPFAFELYADLKSEGSGGTGGGTEGSGVAGSGTEGNGGTGSVTLCERFKKTFCHKNVKIHFLGAWDTVSSIGVVRGKSLPKTDTFNEDICYFRHALALDERRVKFLPEYVEGGESYRIADTRDHVSRVKEVWFSGCHSDIGGGGQSNTELNNASVPVLWMGNEALIAGLRLEPHRFEWKWEDLQNSKPKESLTLGWRLFEILPFKRLSYMTKAHHTWWPHLAGVRVIKPGQKVHASVAFIHGNYTPKATLLTSGTELEWEHILCKGKKDSVDWAKGLQHLLEMDLFDYSDAKMIVAAALAKDETENTFFTERLQFMASFYEGAKAIDKADQRLELVCKMLKSNVERVKDAGALLLCKVAVWVLTRSEDLLNHLPPKDKLAKWITMDNDDKLGFNILEPVVTRYGLAHTKHKLDPSTAIDIHMTVINAALFFRFFNAVPAPDAVFEANIQIEFTRLKSSKDNVDGPFDTPSGQNLYVNGTVNIQVDIEDEIIVDYYGIKVTNNTSSDLYLGVLDFNPSDFSLINGHTAYDITPTRQYKLKQPLKANGGSQPIGYGSSHSNDPYQFSLPYYGSYAMELDVTLIGLYFFPVKKHADVSKTNPYDFFRNPGLEASGTILIPVVQHRKPKGEPGLLGDTSSDSPATSG